MEVFRLAVVLCAFIAALVRPSAGNAETPAEFYQHKTITVVVITAPGGTYDLYGRLVSKYLPRFIPGAPSSVVKYVPGANGVIGHLHLYNKAAQDGTEIGIASQDIAINQVLYQDGSRFDIRKFQWIGRIATYTGVFVVASRTGVKTAADLRTIPIVTGSWAATGGSFITPTLLNSLAGTKIKIVTGYSGAASVDLALERGEVDALSSSWTSLKARKAQWLADKAVVVPVQLANKKHPDLPDVPQMRDLALTPEGRGLMEYVESDTGIGFSLVAPPNVPADRLEALRTGYAQMVRDPEFLAEATARNLEIVPADHTELEGIMNRTLSIPPDDIVKLRAMIGAGRTP